MLVMTTIFMTVMQMLPATAYIKMIDIFLIFGQLYPFAEVVLLTIMEYHRDGDGSGEEKPSIDSEDATAPTGPCQAKKVAQATDPKEETPATGLKKDTPGVSAVEALQAPKHKLYWYKVTGEIIINRPGVAGAVL